jgi:polyhydroxyalkanoate synthesis regulator phasin
LISWKNSFKEISKDLELTKKKKQALDDLFNEGRISESTYESLNKEVTGTITDIEARRKALAEKVTSKINELEQQITVLEMFLANSVCGSSVTSVGGDGGVGAGSAGIRSPTTSLTAFSSCFVTSSPKAKALHSR